MTDWQKPEGFIELEKLGPIEIRANTSNGPIYGRIVGMAPKFMFGRKRMWPIYRTCDKNGEFI